MKILNYFHTLLIAIILNLITPLIAMSPYQGGSDYVQYQMALAKANRESVSTEKEDPQITMNRVLHKGSDRITGTGYTDGTILGYMYKTDPIEHNVMSVPQVAFPLPDSSISITKAQFVEELKTHALHSGPNSIYQGQEPTHNYNDIPAPSLATQAMAKLEVIPKAYSFLNALLNLRKYRFGWATPRPTTFAQGGHLTDIQT